MFFCPRSLKAFITIWTQTMIFADNTTHDLVVSTTDNGKMCDFHLNSTFYSIKAIQILMFPDLSLEIAYSLMNLHRHSNININAGLFLSKNYTILSAND